LKALPVTPTRLSVYSSSISGSFATSNIEGAYIGLRREALKMGWTGNPYCSSNSLCKVCPDNTWGIESLNPLVLRERATNGDVERDISPQIAQDIASTR
jgi:hypothetical protein